MLSGPLFADPGKDESGHGYAAYSEAEREYWKRQGEFAREERKRREEAVRQRRKREREWARESRERDRHYDAYPVYESYGVPVPEEYITITRDGIGGWIKL